MSLADGSLRVIAVNSKDAKTWEEVDVTDVRSDNMNAVPPPIMLLTGCNGGVGRRKLNRVKPGGVASESCANE